MNHLKVRELILLKEKVKLLKSSQLQYYKPHIKQQEFHALGRSVKERLFLAGNRCGKTHCGAMEMAMHLTGCYPAWWTGLKFNKPIHAWAASVTAESTRDILQHAYLGNGEAGCVGALPLDKVIRTTAKRAISGALDTVYVRHSSGGVSTLGFKSYDQGREKFQGTSKDFIHLDEEPDVKLYEECLMRTLDVGGHVMLTMTPLKGMTDVCLHFLNDTDNDAKKVVQATWDDAIYLSESEKKSLRKSLRPHELEAREKGIPSLGAGKVYPIKESDIVVPRFNIPNHFARVFGMDFGWTNPTAVVWLAYDKENDIVYLTDVYTQSEATPAEHTVYIQSKGVWIPGVCDPAGGGVSQSDGTSIIERYAEHGLYLNKANNSVESGLMDILERMQTGRFKVFEGLDAWLDEFRLYRRDEQGRIVKKHDHLMDATRYAVVSGLALAKSAESINSKAVARTGSWRTA